MWFEGSSLLAWPLNLSLLLSSASAFAAERERLTWDSVLTSPLDSREIVLGKLSGSFWEARWWILATALLLTQELAVRLSVPGGIAGLGPPFAQSVLPARLLTLLVTAGSASHLVGNSLFLVGAGLLVSLYCRSSGKSLAITLGVWLASGIVAGILFTLVIALGASVFFWWTSGNATLQSALAGNFFAQVAVHLIWIMPLGSGLFWGTVAMIMVWFTVTQFDLNASRMRGRTSRGLTTRTPRAS
jgi:ABC-type transport system involved in multi-copper enzyme maturation permease subunit